MSGILEEHAPRERQADTNSATYNPSPEDQKTIKLVETLFEKARKHREKYDGEWLDFYHMFRGKQWKEKRPTYRHSEVLNLIFRSFQSTIPILLDVNPRIEFSPQEPSDREFADIMNKVVESEWNRENWARTVLEVVYDAYLYGSGLSYQSFDANADHKAGKLVFESADPFYCFPDPNSVGVNKKGCYFIYAEPKDLSVVKRDYPEMKDYLKADLIDLMKGDKNELKIMRFRSPVDNKLYVEAQDSKMIDLDDKILVKTCWILPEGTYDEFDEEEIESINDSNGMVEKTYVQKAKYPNGRKIVTASGVLLEDSENPFTHGQIPYAKFDNYVLPREFWGESEVQQLAGPQKTVNKVASFFLDVMTLTGNPIWKVHASSNIDTDNLTNKPGMVLEWAGDYEPKREEGVQLQPFILQVFDRYLQVFNQLSGDQDVSRGIRPEGITAASAIDALQEAAQTRIRLKSDNIDCFLQDVGQQLQANVLQFFTSPRIFRITNDQNAQKYFKVQANPDKSNITIINYNDDNSEGFPQDIKVGKLDTIVRTGSSLPFVKTQLKNERMKLFEMGVIDEEELLKSIEYPNYQQVIQRLNEKKAAMAEQEAMAAQGAPA